MDPREYELVCDHVTRVTSRHLNLSAKSGLEKGNPMIVSLPLGWLRDSLAICRRLSSMMPAGTLTSAERRALDPSSYQTADGGAETIRFSIVGFPGYPVGNETYLHTAPVDGIALRVIAQLASGLDASPGYGMDLASRRTFRKWIHADGRGPALLQATIRRVLFRSYADGCRLLLGQANPGLYALRSTRPARRFPWVEMQIGSNAYTKIVWTRQMIL